MIVFLVGAVIGALLSAAIGVWYVVSSIMIGGSLLAIAATLGVDFVDWIRRALHTRQLRIDGRLPSGRVINVQLEGWRRR